MPTNSPAFNRLATVEASTKRSSAPVAGKRGEPAINIATLQCWPIDPIGVSTAERLRREGLQTPQHLLQTVAGAGLDIAEGDLLVVAGREYNVRRVEAWAWRGAEYKLLIVEAPKR